MQSAVHKLLAAVQDNEIKNGRLAMVAFLGFIAQHAATGKVRQYSTVIPLHFASVETCCLLPNFCLLAALLHKSGVHASVPYLSSMPGVRTSGDTIS